MARTRELDAETSRLEAALPEVAQHTYRRFAGSNGHLYSAAISYFALISMFPALIFLVTFLTWVAPEPAVQNRVIDQVVNQFPPGARIRLEIRAFVAEIVTRRSGLLGVLGLVTTIVIASEAFRALRYALNALSGVPQTRSFLRGRAIDVLGMLVVLTFGLISTGMTAMLQEGWLGVRDSITAVGGSPLIWAAQIVLPFILSFVAFTLMYRVVPELNLGWSVLWIPGLIAATGFELAKHGMGLFLTYFDRFQMLYGALSVTVVLLVFVFLVANIVLLAGSLAIEIDRARRESG
jgi:membrane protein